jgi:hypothetical protein
LQSIRFTVAAKFIQHFFEFSKGSQTNEQQHRRERRDTEDQDAVPQDHPEVHTHSDTWFLPVVIPGYLSGTNSDPMTNTVLAATNANSVRWPD